MERDTFQGLMAANEAAGRHLCVGLELPPLEATPDYNVWARHMVLYTAEQAAAIKIGWAYWIAWPIGLVEFVQWVNEQAPHVIVILDACFSGSHNQAKQEADFAFGLVKADAVTLGPIRGWDSAMEFARYRDKGCFVLCTPGKGRATPGLSRAVVNPVDGQTISCAIAEEVVDWTDRGNFGLMGAGQTSEIQAVRHYAPRLPMLVEEIERQGSAMTGHDLSSIVRAASQNRAPFLVTVSGDLRVPPAPNLFDSYETRVRQAAAEWDRWIRGAVPVAVAT